jgi:hypothetical protein
VVAVESNTAAVAVQVVTELAQVQVVAVQAQNLA